ncbi:MAG: class I SAM-dependent methyltransferase [Candidatus Hadarchaeales archaeon]
MGGEPSKPHVKTIWQLFLKHGCRRILDVGCGYGWLGKHKPEGLEVIGIDIEKRKLELAEKHEAVVIGDVCHLPFKDSSFDGVLASHVLEHIPDDLRAMKEIFRVLRGEGILIAEAPTPWWGAKADPTHLRSYVVESFSELDSLSYRIGIFLANRLHLLKGYVFMVCLKPKIIGDIKFMTVWDLGDELNFSKKIG